MSNLSQFSEHLRLRHVAAAQYEENLSLQIQTRQQKKRENLRRSRAWERFSRTQPSFPETTNRPGSPVTAGQPPCSLPSEKATRCHCWWVVVVFFFSSLIAVDARLVSPTFGKKKKKVKNAASSLSGVTRLRSHN